MFAIFNVRSAASASPGFATREEAEAAMAVMPPSRVQREVREAEPVPPECWGEYGPDGLWEV